MSTIVYAPFPAPCPQCGRDDGWNDLGCMECGLEFFPPSGAYWAASALTIAERVAALLEDWSPDVPGDLPDSASPIERAFWEAHCRLGLPELTGLVPQHRAGRFRIDFALPGLMAGIELDGFRNHSSTADIARDHLRQRWLEGLGWRIIRFGGSEVYHDAEYCVRQAAWLIRRAQEAVIW